MKQWKGWERGCVKEETRREINWNINSGIGTTFWASDQVLSWVASSPTKKKEVSMGFPFLSILLHLLIIFICWFPLGGVSECNKDGVIFVFGDSNSDTGGLTSGLGYPINLPNGRSFFHRSTGRLSDGRLIIDFLCNPPPTPLSLCLFIVVSDCF